MKRIEKPIDPCPEGSFFVAYENKCINGYTASFDLAVGHNVAHLESSVENVENIKFE